MGATGAVGAVVKRILNRSLALGLSVGAALSPVAAQDSTPAPRSPRLALLVGVDEYAEGTPANFPTLTGCVADVERVRGLLTERFDFEAPGIRLLRNSEATHEAVVRGFQDHLIDRATPETEVVIWFSGHGSRVPDRSGRGQAERDRLDSTWVLHDSRSGSADGAYDFCDDELRALLVALTSITPRVLVVTDSCHSGAVVRDADAGSARAAPPGRLPLDIARLRPFWPAGLEIHEDGRGPVLEARSYVHVAACGADQVARELTVETESGSVRHGALSWHLIHALEEAQPGARIGSLVDRAAARLARDVLGQTAQAEGALDRRLFRGDFAPSPPGFAARSLGNGRVRVAAGRLHGLSEGARLRFMDRRGERVLGEGRVERLLPDLAFARIESADGTSLEDGGRAIEAEGDLRALELWSEAVEGALGIWPRDELAESWLGADVPEGLVLATDRHAGTRLESTEEGFIEWRSPEGLLLWKGSLPSKGADHRQGWDQAIRDEHRYRSLVELAAEDSEFALEGSFVAPSESELTSLRSRARPAYGAEELADRGPGGAVLARPSPDGEISMAVLEVRNPHARDLHLAVVSVAEDRSRHLVWPLAARHADVLPAGETLRIRIGVVRDPSWPLDRPMLDRYLIIATPRAADFSTVEHNEPTRGPGGDSLPEALRRALSGDVTRGVDRPRSEGGEGFGLTIRDLAVGADHAP